MSADDPVEELVDLGARIVERARKKGADVAEAVVRGGSHLTTKIRMREPELVEEAGSRAAGLRVMLGQQVAVVYSSDLTPDGIERLVESGVELARLSQPDPFAGPPDASLLLGTDAAVPDLQLFDPEMGALGADDALAMARAGEAAALDADARITNSEGATVSRADGASALVTSGGFARGHRGSYASLVVRPIADDTDGKKRGGFHWTARRHLAELDDPVAVGKEAARRTLRQLGATKPTTQTVPVVFDPDAGRAILDLLAGCVNGSAIWRRSSYLVDRVGSRVASDLVTVVDDPLMPKAPGSRPFDGEGLPSRRNVVVENGILRTYLLDAYSARKLESQSTGSAARGPSGGVGPSTTNFVLQPGSVGPEAVIAGVENGLYVTEMMGFGFNAVTGDFSRGASGFWITNGELGPAVSEVTISLNVDQLFQNIDAVADDLDLRTATATPTFRVRAMTVAGA